MAKPRALIFAGYGLNCEEETQLACELAGAEATIVHINDLIDGRETLDTYQILIFPGGFSYGDDTGSGKAYANRVRTHLWEDMQRFLQKDHLIAGICNGFQIISHLGLLPALEKQYGTPQAGLLHNTSARYTARWVDLKVENQSPWLKGMSTFPLPIAHGEGKVYLSPETLAEAQQKKLIALKYTEGEISAYQHLPANPNGSLEDIAGLTDESGRILGLMPHPERAFFFTHMPHWPLQAEVNRRQQKPLPTHGPGMALFENAVRYFQ
jgi:phosphoribosylformylglycinamidine synthase I